MLSQFEIIDIGLLNVK